SLLGRKEVLRGKAKFGILGDGKEVPQVAMARAFQKGDFRAGYYRDQTFMMAIGLCSVEDFFAQLYADPENDPFSGGRQMNSHYATPFMDEEGNWLDLKNRYNITSGISPTAGQMARALGLALASKKYRSNKNLHESEHSNKGREVTFCTIGDASTSEGVFWETVNAAGVMQVPLAISIWDDGYGISVPKEFQTTKGSISEVLDGFSYDAKKKSGMDIYKVNAWDYPRLCEVYEAAIAKSRATHIPALIHVEECTQPQGHSTSGSHERYKSAERLEWEAEYDCIKKMREWIIETGIASEEELDQIRKAAKKQVRAAQKAAWDRFAKPILEDRNWLVQSLEAQKANLGNPEWLDEAISNLKGLIDPETHQLVSTARKCLRHAGPVHGAQLHELKIWLRKKFQKADEDYHTNLYASDQYAAISIPEQAPVYAEDAKMINGFQILNQCFDHALANRSEVYAFGEDVGHIGDVNQGFAGLQDKHGVDRVFDTGIREWTIMGQAIGMAMRGLRPIAEIQYLDYLLYGLTPLSDDLATLRYRSDGLQQAPAIIRTRGHRLEGIWHTGSPIGMVLHSLRGIYVCVPRNMTQAAGMYNTLLQSNDPALVIECLNGYRLKEREIENIDTFTVPLGKAEVIKEGEHVTLVSYGSTLRVARDAARQLAKFGVSVEIVDPQTLLPFDLNHAIGQSLKKTNRLVIVDEDVPGGASAYILQQILELQSGYFSLDSAPLTITAYAHRAPYGSTGDYFSKPNADQIFDRIYTMMHAFDPATFPALEMMD
ncbi:MAG: thiamine pyrophosphate-dependent enzyme, partial [Bacteroidota bacterium]